MTRSYDVFPTRYIRAPMVIGVQQEVEQTEDPLRSRNHEIESSRHVILSTEGGVVTELEWVRADQYIVRCHKSTADAGVVLDAGLWIGFRYRDSQWSFVIP